MYIPVDEGEVIFEGNKISKITPAEATQMGQIQVIYQDLSIFSKPDGYGKILQSILRLQQEESLSIRKRWEQTAKEALSKFGYNIDLQGQKMGELSVADKQTGCHLPGTSFNAKLIIVDEPTTRTKKRGRCTV